MIINPNDSVLQPLNLENVIDYLARNGWREIDLPNKRFAAFEGPLDDYGEPIVLSLPCNTHFRDWPLRLAEAVNLLSALEERSPETIVQEIVHPKLNMSKMIQDIFKVKVLNISAAIGTISLDLAPKLVTGLAKLVSLAALVEESPRPYFGRAPSLNKYARSFRFGQTFAGSFGFTIHSPVAEQTSFNTDADPPFERRVMERIVQGLVLAKTATHKQDASILVQNYQAGLNANMCESLLDMTCGKRDVEFEYTIVWSPNWKPSKGLEDVGVIHLNYSDYWYLEQAASKLREEKEEEPREVKIAGKTTLSQETTGQDIRIKWEAITVKVVLSPDDYRKACDAHRDHKLVSVEGTLYKHGNFAELRDYHNFEVE